MGRVQVTLSHGEPSPRRNVRWVAMTNGSPDTQPVHPFQTPAAEGFFKALLWIVLLLQIAVFARMYNHAVRNLPERGQTSTWQAR